MFSRLDVQGIAARIQPHLSGEWNMDRPLPHLAVLARGDGLTLLFRNDCGRRNEERLEVSAVCPGMPGAGTLSPLYYGLDNNPPSATFDPDRDAALIAMEIDRRIIQPWLPDLQEILRRREVMIAEREPSEDLAARLAEICGSDMRGGPLAKGYAVQVHLGVRKGERYYGHFEVPAHARGIKLTLDGLPNHVALRLAEVLADAMRSDNGSS